jgi:hypothetical protein
VDDGTTIHIRKVRVMPTSDTRHRVEIPRDLYQALNQAAAEAQLPTSALVTMWLWQLLETRRPDLHLRDPYRSGVELYERRPRRPGELANTVPLDEARTVTQDTDQDDHDRPSSSPPNLTTVRLGPQEGGLLPLHDRHPTQC